ncbi:hypothetical protein [Methanoculleus sp.]|uniref:hypothetical protein n=1 Tax=Methanoculleus sp. TaxID=90427 RepID=UPI0025F8B4EC|nr:hypothetical protein [Methanoculleus sp.]
MIGDIDISKKFSRGSAPGTWQSPVLELAAALKPSVDGMRLRAAGDGILVVVPALPGGAGGACVLSDVVRRANCLSDSA